MSEKMLFLFSLYLPFQFALSPSASVDLASIRIIIIVIFLSWLFIGLFKRKLVIPTDKTSLLLYSFLFLAFFSLFLAKNHIWGLRKAFFLLSIFPVYLIFNEAHRRGWLLKISKGLIYGSFAVSLIGIIQFLSQFLFGIERVYAFWGKFIAPIFLGNAFSAAVLENPSWLVNISGKTVFRAISIFPDPHMFSFYLGMTAPIALALHFYFKKDVFFLAAFGIITTTALLTFSRGGYIGILASVIITSLFLLRNTRPRLYTLIRAALMIILLTCLLYTIEPLRDRFLSSFDFQEGSNHGRIELWSKATETIRKQPFGVGIGNLPLVFVPTASYRDPIYAHNLYLDIAVELGVFALISILAVFFFSFTNLLKLAQQNILYGGILASLSFFLAYSLVETSLYSVHVLPLLLILLSFSNTHEYPKNN